MSAVMHGAMPASMAASWGCDDAEGATAWLNRCVAHIRSMDRSVTLLEADALARALWASPICRSDSPESSAEKLLARHPLPARWMS